MLPKAVKMTRLVTAHSLQWSLVGTSTCARLCVWLGPLSETYICTALSDKCNASSSAIMFHSLAALRWKQQVRQQLPLD